MSESKTNLNTEIKTAILKRAAQIQAKQIKKRVDGVNPDLRKILQNVDPGKSKKQ